MGIVKTEAVILKCDNYRETSKIITFYSKSHGKLRGIAKGVRSSKTKWGGVLQSMAHLNLMFYYKENRTLHLVTSAEYASAHQKIYSDFDKMEVGFRLIELVNRTTAENHENKEIFELITESLANLNDATKNYVNMLFYYQFRLAKLLGFEINLEAVTHKNIENRIENRYFSKDTAQKFSPGDIKALSLISQGNFNALMCLNISKSTERNIDSFFENYFKTHLDHFSSSKTRKVFNKSA